MVGAPHDMHNACCGVRGGGLACTNMDTDTRTLLKKHAGHTISIWENNEWNVQLDINGRSVSADFGINGGFDDNTPLYCHDCREELPWNDEYETLVREAVEEKYNTM
jgi:hypothetical protein